MTFEAFRIYSYNRSLTTLSLKKKNKLIKKRRAADLCKRKPLTSCCKQKLFQVSRGAVKAVILFCMLSVGAPVGVCLTCICSWRTPCTSTCRPCAVPSLGPERPSHGSPTPCGCLGPPAAERRRRRCPPRRRTPAPWKKREKDGRMGASVSRLWLCRGSKIRARAGWEGRDFKFSQQGKNGCYL